MVRICPDSLLDLPPGGLLLAEDARGARVGDEGDLAVLTRAVGRHVGEGGGVVGVEGDVLDDDVGGEVVFLQRGRHLCCPAGSAQPRRRS